MVVFFPAPYENPADVQGQGTMPSNLVITWTVSYMFIFCFATNQVRVVYCVYHKKMSLLRSR